VVIHQRPGRCDRERYPVRYPKPSSPLGIALHIAYFALVIYVYGVAFNWWRLP